MNLTEAASTFVQTVMMSSIVLTMFLTGAQLEGKLLPVASIVVEGGHWEGDEYVFYGELKKDRACEFKGAFFRDREAQKEYLVEFPPRTSEADPDVSRPVGVDRFEDWRMKNPRQGAWVEAHAHHRCHELWDTFSFLGYIRIPYKDTP